MAEADGRPGVSHRLVVLSVTWTKRSGRSQPRSSTCRRSARSRFPGHQPDVERHACRGDPYCAAGLCLRVSGKALRPALLEEGAKGHGEGLPLPLSRSEVPRNQAPGGRFGADPARRYAEGLSGARLPGTSGPTSTASRFPLGRPARRSDGRNHQDAFLLHRRRRV